MKYCLIPSFFCPPLSLWAEWLHAGNLVVDDLDFYQRKRLHNRYFISGPNGVQMLSIPIKGAGHPVKILKDVCIAYDEPWARKHVQAVRSAYGKSAYFEYYFEDWAQILLSGPQYLHDLNLEMLVFINQCLKSDQSFINASAITDMDGVDKLSPKKTGMIIPATNTGLDFYPQVWQDRFGYIHNLSIIDLIFCCGPESVLYLNKIKKFFNTP